MRALVVDDSAMMRKVLIGALARYGIAEVDQAANGADAVTAVGLKEYNLVLLDWNMPVMSGIEALRALRQQGRTMPVIMVTTEAEKERVMEALKSGANSYVIKPFTPESIIAKIKDVLEKAAA